MFAGLGIMIFPLLITTLILAVHARWSWMRTMDKILDGMKLDSVRQRVEKADWHRQFARYHAFAVAIMVVITMILTYLENASINYVSGYQWLGIMPIWMFVWVYGLFVPHLLALYVYHVRWNPKTILRKQKLDAENEVYQGNYRLDPDAQYTVNDEGELINLAELDADDVLYLQSK